MADLSSGRLQVDKPPFLHVEVDYFWHFLVTQRRSKVKRYGCIFTCLTVRAVHLEISHNLTTDSFINALRRFLARRGPPEQFYSDNGTNLVGATRLLRQALRNWNQYQISDYSTAINIATAFKWIAINEEYLIWII